MKVVVCGSRDADDEAFVWHTLDELHRRFRFVELMQGGCRGVDALAKRWAKRQRPYVWDNEEKADWNQHGKAAGPIRNAKMVAWGPDLVIAFPGGSGTADMVRQAEAAKIPVYRVRQWVCQ